MTESWYIGKRIRYKCMACDCETSTTMQANGRKNKSGLCSSCRKTTTVASL